MGDLRDQLKKAGLISDRAAKKLARADKQREHDKLKAERAGDAEKLAALETDADRLRRERETAADQRRAEEAKRVEEERRLREEEAAWNRVQAIIDSNRIRPGRGDRWKFVDSAGLVEELQVSDEVAAGLQGSELAIVERPPRGAKPDDHRFVVLPMTAALRVEAIDPFAIRFLNLPGRPPPPTLVEDEVRSADLDAAEDDFLQGL